jgi:diaminohydroxyphosphoribosylaminopyrimidine deaminase / 5-amino-6-(5-phosphoribosylamino)uracil reductase
MLTASSKRSGDVTDADYMARALFHAARGRGRTSPNPAVGAVVVTPDGVVVGQGYHKRAGEPHAEIHALNMAGVRARGATLYCTLEPCSHTGRTGPCAVRVVEAGIARVVAAIEDPNPLVCGRGFAYLRERGVTVNVGLAAAAATRLNRPYLTYMKERRPWVTLKAAISVDGCIAELRERRSHLTSAAANRHAHGYRAEVDAIAVGVGTVIADNPLLTARGVYRERPLLRVVFDRQLRTPPGSRLLSTLNAGPVMIVTSPEAAGRAEARNALEARGAETLVACGVREALAELGDRGVASLLLEGGAALHQAAWDEQVVDFVRLYVTPHVLGAGGVRFLNGYPFLFSELLEPKVEPLGVDVLMEGYVHGPR